MPIIRPFYPGGDYESAEYPARCVVIDNPPFSILAQIINFYNSRGIRYFLFAPTLTLFSHGNACNYIVIDKAITYENGAVVATSFLTNMGKAKVHLSGRLNAAIIKAEKSQRKSGPPKYDCPPNVINAARMQKYIKGETEIVILEDECHFIRALDAQRAKGKSIFGAGFLISSRAAARLEAARLEAARLEAARLEAARLEVEKDVTIWELSDRERIIVKCLDDGAPIPMQAAKKMKILPTVEGGEQMRMDI